MCGLANDLTRPGVYTNLKRYVPSIMVHCKKIYIRKQYYLPVYYYQVLKVLFRYTKIDLEPFLYF